MIRRGLFDEPVAEAVNGNDVPGLRRVLFDFLPQPRDVVVYRARNRRAVIPPNFVEQLVACDDFAPAPDEVVKNLKLAW